MLTPVSCEYSSVRMILPSISENSTVTGEGVSR